MRLIVFSLFFSLLIGIALAENFYNVKKVGDRELEITDIRNNEVKIRKFDFNIYDFEKCSAHSYYILRTDKQGDYKNYVFDVEENTISEIDTRDNSNFWSPDGEICYLNEVWHFYLFETRYLKSYLKDKKIPAGSVKITGHPLGFINHVEWIGERLVYSNGVGGGWTAYGLYDTAQNQNYFLRIYNNRKGKYKGSISEIEDDIEGLIRDVADKEEIRIISEDFYKEIGLVLK